MSIFSGLMGNASAVDAEKVQAEYANLLAPGEAVQHAYKLVRDLFIFTDKRLILVDKQGITGRKVEYLSLPYRSIVRFSIETAGSFDLEAELKIWLSGSAEPIQKTFNKNLNVYALQAVLASYVLR